MWVDVVGEIKRRFLRKPTTGLPASQPALVFQQGDGCGGTGLTLTPANGNYSSLFIWLHGLGDTPFSWYGTMAQFAIRSMPDTKFVLPLAPTRKITVYHGTSMQAWYDIFGLDDKCAQDRERIAESTFAIQARINNIIIEQGLQAGVKPSRVAVGGFSLGGALALHVVLRSKYKLAGCAVASGWLPLESDYPEHLSAEACKTPICMSHGLADRRVPVGFAGRTHSILSAELKLAVAFHTYDGLGHSTCASEMVRIGQFVTAAMCRSR
ncbi:hypothetical protein AURANDRAFT_32841 [Aureococcus anophagefferens]|uniref:Phospholipase/carboxylesterase/thioesterase domain-containing protein n=1 Tax=Aureococcus anophagefferens TaxID=44056 RepID=F0YL04_AURAN|nr:hypothetical protein AURANDRAFT_32841 [Aureococcus anophagefferens]EGB04217.1 hypothetical protein AURANDRAFT_32841 [Aureococcus anophagefferens]|eukprot:XP_009041069.1 hypothetical protein AURANDRAFT_32841 [Aureococcus anophagefferens]